MKNQYVSVKAPKTVFSQVKEQTVNAELMLPDYYPEIAKILDCDISLSEESVTVTADQISVAGAAKIRLLYTSQENELRVFETVSKYTRVLAGSGFSAGDVCFVRQNISSMNVRAVSPRKAEVHASAAVGVQLMRLEEQNLLADTDDADLQKNVRTQEAYMASAFSVVKTEIGERISLPVQKNKIREILKQRVNVTWNNVRAGTNKIVLGGVAEITFSYITTDNEVSGENTVSLPFSAIKELYGAAEEDRCDLMITGETVEIDLKNESDTEASVLIGLQMAVLTGRKATVCFCNDAYSLRGDVKISTVQAELPCGVGEFKESIPFSGEAQIYDAAIREICGKNAADVVCSLSPDGDAVHVNGSLTVKILCRGEDGTYYCFARKCSFEYADAAMRDEPLGIPEITVKEISADIGPDRITWRGEICCRIVALNGERVNAVAELDATDGETGAVPKDIVLYYADPGESVWQIAKENRTDYMKLMELNGLKEAVLQEKKLLIFRS